MSGTAAATGFFVSNTGQNIAIGQTIDYSAAIGVSGAGSDAAISAKGDINGIGDLNISASGTFGGNVNASGGNITNSLNVGDGLFQTGSLNLNQSSSIKKMYTGYAFFYFNPPADPSIAYDVVIGGGPSLPLGFAALTGDANWSSTDNGCSIVLGHPTVDRFKTVVLVTPRYSNADAAGVFFSDSLTSIFASRVFNNQTIINVFPARSTTWPDLNNVKFGFNFTFIEYY